MRYITLIQDALAFPCFVFFSCSGTSAKKSEMAKNWISRLCNGRFNCGCIFPVARGTVYAVLQLTVKANANRLAHRTST